MSHSHVVDRTVNVYPADSKEGKMIFTLVSVVFVIISLIMFGISVLVGGIDNKLRERCTAETEALCIELVASEREDDEYGASTSYAPVLTFTAEDGKEYTVRSTSFSYPPVCEKGDTVQLFYDPDDPKTFYLPDDKALNIVSTIFRLISLVMLLVAGILIAVLVSIKIKSRKSNTDELNEYR